MAGVRGIQKYGLYCIENMETGMARSNGFLRVRWGSIFLMMPVKSLNAKAFAGGDEMRSVRLLEGKRDAAADAAGGLD